MEKPEFIDIPKTAKAGVRNIVQPSELAVLFSEDTIIDRGSKKFVYYIYAYRFIVILGLRRGELAGIMHSDINDNVLHIRRSVNPLGEITGGKTENAARKIYLPELARKILSDQAKMLKEYDIESDYVFPSPSGEIMDTNSLYQHWRSYRRQHNINSSLHELRHTMISVMKADMPEQLLKSVVGHSDSMDTFGVYGHEVDGDLERAAQVIDDVYGKIIKM
jgi:integrase